MHYTGDWRYFINVTGKKNWPATNIVLSAYEITMTRGVTWSAYGADRYRPKSFELGTFALASKLLLHAHIRTHVVGGNSGNGAMFLVATWLGNWNLSLRILFTRIFCLSRMYSAACIPELAITGAHRGPGTLPVPTGASSLSSSSFPMQSPPPPPPRPPIRYPSVYRAPASDCNYLRHTAERWSSDTVWTVPRRHGDSGDGDQNDSNTAATKDVGTC